MAATAAWFRLIIRCIIACNDSFCNSLAGGTAIPQADLWQWPIVTRMREHGPAIVPEEDIEEIVESLVRAQGK
ncbi:MAG: hypothetical protein Kow0099_04850 [Candidatus Abyssubacteria bacterium]